MEVLSGQWWRKESKLRRRRGQTKTTTRIENFDPVLGLREHSNCKMLPPRKLSTPLYQKYPMNFCSCTVEEDDRSWLVKSQFPFLMLTQHMSKGVLQFFSLSDGSVHSIELPSELRVACCVGSSSGWLLMSRAVPVETNNLSEDLTISQNKVHIEDFLFNPFLKASVQLPSQKTLPFFYSFCQRFIRKVALSSPPTSANIQAGKCIVVIVGIGGILAFCRPGDVSWTVLEAAHAGIGYADILFYEGKLHAISKQEQLRIFDLLGGGELTRVDMIPPTDRLAGEPVIMVHGHEVFLGEGVTIYLAESDGELIMILRIWKCVPEYEEQIICPIRTLQYVCLYIYI